MSNKLCRHCGYIEHAHRHPETFQDTFGVENLDEGTGRYAFGLNQCPGYDAEEKDTRQRELPGFETQTVLPILS